MSVYLDGATLSALLFRHLNSSGSQYGFLIGEKIEHIEDRISDSQIHTVDVNSYIYVSSFVPWPSREHICSRDGHFRDDWIKHFLTNTEQTVVGWYSFRHNTSARPSLREKTLHSNLATPLSFARQPNDFLFFLCTSSFSSNMSTHTSTHGFMHKIDGHFVNVTMTVMNLGDTTRTEYKKRSNAALNHSKTVQQSLHTFRFLKSSGEMEQIAKVNHLATSINKSLMSVHNKVFESEAALGLLETDVHILRQRLEQFEQEEFRISQVEKDRKRTDKESSKQTKDQDVEQEELEKLLINLEISNDGASSFTSSVNHTALFPVVENCLNNQHVESFQVISPSPLHSIEHVCGSNSSNDTNCAAGGQRYFQTYNNRSTGCEHKNDGLTKINNFETKKPQTIMEKVSEAFSFLDEELKLKNVGVDRKQVAHSHASKKCTGASVVYREACDKNLVSSSSHGFSKDIEHSRLSTIVPVGAKIVNNGEVVTDTTHRLNVNPPSCTSGDVLSKGNHLISH